MKATRKLIPAIAMLLISAVMMSTATFAWFSTNSEVQATGMSLSAKADSAFIVISGSATDADTKKTTYTDASKTGALVPVTAYTSATVEDTKVSNGSKADGVANIIWATGTAADPGASALNDAGLSKVDADSTYVVTGTFYIRTAAGFPSASNLILKSFNVTGTSKFASAVSLVLEVDGNYFVYEGAERGTPAVEDNSETTDVNEAKDATDADNDILAAIVPSATPIKITYYLYINGEDASVFTDNAIAANLGLMNVTMTFAVGGVVTPPPAEEPEEPEGT